jgi:hypothetical protein
LFSDTQFAKQCKQVIVRVQDVIPWWPGQVDYIDIDEGQPDEFAPPRPSIAMKAFSIIPTGV